MRTPRQIAGHLSAARWRLDRMAVTLREVSTHLDAIEAQLRVDPRSVAIAFDNLVAAGRTRSQALAVLQAQFERTPKHIERLIRDGRKLLKTLGADS